jgi:stage IV sporulation protein FB
MIPNVVTRFGLHKPSIGIFGKVHIHPLSIVLIVLACGAGLWREIVVLFILIMLHELGHAATAYSLGYEVESVSLLPFGGVARMSYGNIGFTPKHEALIAISGPMVNFILTLFAVLLSALGFWSHAFAYDTIRLNTWIAVFNLLPAMPLDGGRILRAARSRSHGFETATREAYAVGMVFATVLLMLGGISLWAGYPHFGILVLGVFLFVSAWVGRREIRMELMRFLDAKKRRQKQSIDEVRSFAVPSEATVKDVVTRFGPDRFHLIYVIGDSGEVHHVLQEDDLLKAVFDGEWLKPVGEVH